MRWRRVRSVCASVSLLATTIAPNVGADTGGASTVTAARLRITIATTSNWSQVRISPGYLAATRVVSHSREGQVSSSPHGVKLTGVVGNGTVVADVVLAEPNTASVLQVEVDKGALGTTEVVIRNTNDKPYDVADITDERHDAGNTNEPVTSTVSRNLMMSTVPLWLPKNDYRRLALAAYYPWFANYKNRHLADTPVDARSVWSSAGVTSMTRQAQASGINGFVVSWHGNSKDGKAFDLVQRAAEKTGQLFTAYLEVPSAHKKNQVQPPAFVVRQWLLEALNRRSSPSFLKASDGVPVVFVYGMAYLTPQDWHDVLFQVAAQQGVRVHLVGDSLNPAYRPYEWGVHRYAVLASAHHLRRWSRSTELSARAQAAVNPGTASTLYAGTVSPGFNDKRLRGDLNPVIKRGSRGQRYDATWSAALAGNPDWVFVSTWNEWFEDTQVEPGSRTGDRALAQTAKNIAAWRG